MANTDGDRVSYELLFNHVVLPRRLPSNEDLDPAAISKILNQRLLAATRQLRDKCPDAFYSALNSVSRALFATQSFHTDGFIDKDALTGACHQLEPGDFLILHIVEQNAGLVIRRNNANVSFDAFEASPTSADVLASGAALQWEFPGSSVSLSVSTFDDDRFLDNFAQFMDRASHETIHQFVATTAKAGHEIAEYRDTASPSLITSMLMTILGTNGQYQQPCRICKRVRDDVCFGSKGKPWRRSAFWLVLRVAIQQSLHIMLGPQLGRATYKAILALVLLRLCEDARSSQELALEHVAMARTKLAYRLSKLTAAEFGLHTETSLGALLEQLVDAIRTPCRIAIQDANAAIDSDWTLFKRRMKRPVTILPERTLIDGLTMSMKHSYHYLKEALKARAPDRLPSTGHRQRLDVSKSPCSVIMDRYIELSEHEAQLHRLVSSGSVFNYSTYIDAIVSYQEAVGSKYQGFVEGNSAMLLSIMELWVAIDRLAIDEFPLLADHRPPFAEHMLSVLYIASYNDMKRLQDVEAYLAARHRKCNEHLPTIFGKINDRSFGVRYFDQDSSLQTLCSAIHEKSRTDAEAKREELKKLTVEYNKVAQKRSESTCVTMPDPVHTGLRVHDYQHCTRCWLGRKLSRIKIDVYEYPLPTNESQQKAICFELKCPASFALYRDITWKLIRDLSPNKLAQAAPSTFLFDHCKLRRMVTARECEVALATRTKPMSSTHYGTRKLPLAPTEVCVPFSAFMELFDRVGQVWTAENAVSPSLAKFCTPILPISSSMESLQFDPDFAVDKDGPTPNAILASQTRCPTNANVSEFLTFQDAYSGQTLLWPRLLRELGCSNLNFSSPATTVLVSRIVLQAGPALHHNVLRQRHWVFTHASFCHRLLRQISSRVSAVAGNWRESQSLESMLTVLLRLLALAKDESILEEGFDVLGQIREITAHWIRALRIELHTARNAAIFEQRRKDAIWACLLARRTLNSEALAYNAALESNFVRLWVESSIVLSQNMDESFETMNPVVRQAFIRDWRQFASLRLELEQALSQNPRALSEGVSLMWQNADNSLPQEFETWVRAGEEWFSSSTTAKQGTYAQQVDYNYVKGLLLIDGQPMGKLPEEHRASIVLQDLFGNQPLLTFRCQELPGMAYRLAMLVEDHEVHFGFRGNVLVVKAIHRPTGQIYEHVPATTFGIRGSSDLPGPLMDNCVHWLDLGNARLEVRSKAQQWQYAKTKWVLDLRTWRMWHLHHSLIDPHSALFARATSNFRDFEPSDQMLLYQPTEGSDPRLTLHLVRLDLKFQVNKHGLLQSRELHAEIDPDQDAGTWYGLKSKLVLRNYTTRRLRSIIIPIGTPIITKHGIHVSISIAPSGTYGRFSIDPLLQRLDCAAEPALIYLRVLYHALTSFVLPDGLTGRSGMEEACRYLRGASAQPWTSLTEGQCNILRSISRISPIREYYPTNRKIMQRVTWDDSLTVTIQGDQYHPLVDAIFRRSEAIGRFIGSKAEKPLVPPGTDSWLAQRAVTSHILFSVQSAMPNTLFHGSDLRYQPRDGIMDGTARASVAEVTMYLRDWPSKIRLPFRLAHTLEGWSSFRGFVGALENQTLNDLLTIDFPQQLAPIIEWCRSTTYADRYELMFFFGALSFGQASDMNIIRPLVAFALFEELKKLPPPQWPEYTDFKVHEKPSVAWMTQTLQPCRVPFEREEELLNDARLTTKQVTVLVEEQKSHNALSSRHLALFINLLLMTHWPEPVLAEYVPLDVPLISVSKANELICLDWQRLAHNFQLSEYLSKVERIFAKHQQSQPLHVPSHFAQTSPLRESVPSKNRIPTLAELAITSSLPDTDIVPLLPAASNELLQPGTHLFHSLQDTRPQQTVEQLAEALRHIIGRFRTSDNMTRQQYGQDLTDSLAAFADAPSPRQESVTDVWMPEVIKRIGEGQQIALAQVAALRRALHSDPRSAWLSAVGLWPRVTPNSVLELLLYSNTSSFASEIRKRLVDFGLTITSIQRLIRVEHAARSRQSQILQSELDNLGHTNWDALLCPEWLVLEIESNMMIRTKQVEVARATISPSSHSNSVLQMNMGEGKTSCIIPMVGALLANRQSLLRVIVPKALLPQMAQVLQARLGGLLGRAVTHIPFSRRTPTDLDSIAAYTALHQQSLEQAGVVLALPEHIMSFKLSGLQRLADGRHDEAKAMLQMQSSLDINCRDVLDESDFTLATRTQLIYPSGAQNAVDGHPHRWKVVQTVLHLTRGLLWNLQQQQPRGLEVDDRHGNGYPTVYFLHRDAEDSLVTALTQTLCNGHGNIVASKDLPPGILKGLLTLLSKPSISSSRYASLETHFCKARRNVEWKNLLLLRGLLVHRILILALKKRWNVQYGLHPQRDPISVPYHAKGVPSETAEWGHPDVAILLTCLSFYYAGLSIGQLRQSLTHVLKSDDKAAEYERWLSGTEWVADSLRDCNSLNLDDDLQMSELWQVFRLSTVVVDHYLNNFVFPQHAKQFEQKLQASGWDIPLKCVLERSTDLLSEHDQAWQLTNATRAESDTEAAITTGFSGTNDNRSMLPLTIKQNDLAPLRGTNAEVLTYLLEKRNSRYILAARNRRRFTENDLLVSFAQQGIRVFIDAGAQILESDNLSLVQAWLERDRQRPAAVFFDRNDKAVVYNRQGAITPLLGSPYLDDLSDCLVYLDEAHTRGTDLKLPLNAVGALTLGPGQSKDHTVQAAMRLRQLGTTQSIVWYAPPEVHQSIVDFLSKPPDVMPESKDVIAWLIEQTCKGIEQLQPLFYSQGMDFCRRSQAIIDNSALLKDKSQRARFLGQVQQQEHHSITELYSPKPKRAVINTKDRFNSSEVAQYVNTLYEIRQSFEDTGEGVQALALQEVEQEREVALEAETVRSIQKPPQRRPLSHIPPDQALIDFCVDGRPHWRHFTCSPVFTHLRFTKAGSQFGVSDSTNRPKLFVSQDFTKTVELPVGFRDDSYARPVNWILWSTVEEMAIIISPHEAEVLLPILRGVKKPKTHLLVYAAPVTRKMLQFDDFDYYAVPDLPEGWKAPQWLRRDVGIFAGKLYFKFEDYHDLCRFLGVEPKIAAKALQVNGVSANRVNGATSDAVGLKDANMDGPSDGSLRGKLTDRPLQFLQQWLAVRRKGQDFAHTPMGFVVQSKELDPSHPFFANG